MPRFAIERFLRFYAHPFLSFEHRVALCHFHRDWQTRGPKEVLLRLSPRLYKPQKANAETETDSRSGDAPKTGVRL
ncbi:hypothetical protein VTI28DRAFT_2243 [Corynascus sepedonium]